MTDNKDGLLVNIVNLIGVDQARLLFYARGGQQVYIPTREHLRDNHWLVESIGLEAASTMAEHYGGNILLLPLGVHGLRHRINSHINSRLEAGESTNTIVADTGISYKTICRRRKKLNDPAAPPKQPIAYDLFKSGLKRR
jgi:hypothetical protein